MGILRNKVNSGRFIWIVFLILGICVLTYISRTPYQQPVSKTDVHDVKRNEKYYAAMWSQAHNGDLEYQLEDRTRVDVVTTDYAVEVDFADKWYQSIGQSLHYALHTKKNPGIVLISKNDKDKKYLDRLVAVIQENDLPITVWQMTENTESMIYNPTKEIISKRQSLAQRK